MPSRTNTIYKPTYSKEETERRLAEYDSARALAEYNLERLKKIRIEQRKKRNEKIRLMTVGKIKDAVEIYRIKNNDMQVVEELQKYGCLVSGITFKGHDCYYPFECTSYPIDKFLIEIKYLYIDFDIPLQPCLSNLQLWFDGEISLQIFIVNCFGPDYKKYLPTLELPRSSMLSKIIKSHMGLETELVSIYPKGYVQEVEKSLDLIKNYLSKYNYNPYVD